MQVSHYRHRLFLGRLGEDGHVGALIEHVGALKPESSQRERERVTVTRLGEGRKEGEGFPARKKRAFIRWGPRRQ